MSELEIIDLGCMNGWGPNKPQEYFDHVRCCGKPMFDSKGREVRNYNIKRVELGRCYDQYTCQDCGIQFTVDSSD